MGKLDDIPKHKFFKVPEGYFEQLPDRVHSRLHPPESRALPVLRYALTYLLPLMVAVMIVLLLNGPSATKPETLLSEVETTDLIQYLQEDGITTDEVFDHFVLSDEELEALENEVYKWDFSNLEDDVIDQQ